MGSFGKGSLQKRFCRFPRSFRKLSAPFPDAIKRISANFRKFSQNFPKLSAKKPSLTTPYKWTAEKCHFNGQKWYTIFTRPWVGVRNCQCKGTPISIDRCLCVGNEKCARTLFAQTFLNTPRGPGHPSKIAGTSQIPLFERNTSFSDPLTLAFFDFLAFFVFRFSSLFFVRFPSFSEDFRGSAKRQTPCDFGENPLLFPKKQGLEGQGKEDKLSREGTNFSATTPSCGRPPPHRAVSGPKNLIFVLFSLAWFSIV